MTKKSSFYWRHWLQQLRCYKKVRKFTERKTANLPTANSVPIFLSPRFHLSNHHFSFMRHDGTPSLLSGSYRTLLSLTIRILVAQLQLNPNMWAQTEAEKISFVFRVVTTKKTLAKKWGIVVWFPIVRP